MTNIPLNPDALHQLFAVAMMEVLDAEKLQPGNRLAHVNDIQEVLNRLEKNVLAVAQPEVNTVEDVYTVAIKNTPKSGGAAFYDYPGCTPEIGTLDEAREALTWVKEGWPERSEGPYDSEIGIYKLAKVKP